MENRRYWIFGVLWLGMLMVIPREVWAQGKNFTEKVNGVEFEMIYVKGGTFMMGATAEQDDAYDDEKPVHQVTLSDYYMGKFEVTQGLWEAVMGSNPSSFQKGDDYPVEKVSWNDVQTFLSKLNQLTGKKYALPTEAQWEYAARGGKGGNTNVYVWCGGGAIAFSSTVSGSSGRSEPTKYSGSNDVDEVAWYYDNSGFSTHIVGTKFPNALGIYDMSGNVWEWCSDWDGSYDSEAQTDPMGPVSGSLRVLRGGSWFSSASECRVSNRNAIYPSGCYGSGFRVVLLP